MASALSATLANEPPKYSPQPANNQNRIVSPKHRNSGINLNRYQLDRLRRGADRAVILKIMQLAVDLKNFSNIAPQATDGDDGCKSCLSPRQTQLAQFQKNMKKTFKNRESNIKEKEAELRANPDPHFPDLIKIDLALGNALTTLPYLTEDLNSIATFDSIAKRCSATHPVKEAYLLLQKNIELFASLMKACQESLLMVAPEENNQALWNQTKGLIDQTSQAIDEKFTQAAKKTLDAWESQRSEK